MKGRVAFRTFFGNRRTRMGLKEQVHLPATFVGLLYDPSKGLLVERLAA